MARAFIGRQPVFDAQLRVRAYRLLSASADAPEPDPLPGASVTREAMVRLLDVGWRLLSDGKELVIPWDGELRREHVPKSLPPGRILFAVDESLSLRPAALSTLEDLRRAGYRILLDDWSGTPGQHELLPQCDVVRLRHRGVDPALTVQRLRALDEVRAERWIGGIGEVEEFETAKALGVRAFDGPWIFRPDPAARAQAPHNHALMLRLVAALQDQGVSLDTIESLVRKDVGLSYRLVRLVNSAAFGLRHQVDGIGQAVMLVGLRNLKAWVSMTAIAAVRGKPEELMTRAMSRAWCCELLATHLGDEDTGDRLFTVGLFSVLDALLDLPMERALEGLPLSEALRRALIAHEGLEGAVLQTVIAHEQGEFADVELPGVGPAELTEAFLTSLIRTDEALDSLR